MSKNLYIAAAEAETGKSMIVLGIMDFLSRYVDKIGFFRPVVRSGKVIDNHIDLFHRVTILNLIMSRCMG